jgi:hypothetical protein
MNSVPLAPLVNSFQPERKGQIAGTLTTQAKIKGQGTTGASLQKNLTGQFDVLTTNMNLSVVNVKSRLLKIVVNTVATLPELIRDPAKGIGDFLLGATGGGGGLLEELKRSPIDSIVIHGSAGSGHVDLKQALVQSPAFEAEARGDIMLAPVLTNSSLNIPVSISLSRQLAQRFNLAPADTPTNTVYAKLPEFLTIKGTLGAVKAEKKESVLAGMALKGIGGALPASGTVGNLLNSVGGLLGGGTKSANTNAPPGTNTPSTGTNAPAQNQNPVNNLLKDLFGPKKK